MPNPTTKQAGDAAEDRALRHLQAAGLRLVERNYRTPGRGGGEIDLIVRDRDGTLVFVEVRQRVQPAAMAARRPASAPPSSGASFLRRATTCMRLGEPPPCRFDVVLVEEGVEWMQAAFDAG